MGNCAWHAYCTGTLSLLKAPTYSLHTQVRLDKGTRDTVHEKIEQFRFSALWMSGVASGLSLCIAQYSAFKIQHEHDTTVGQK